MTISSLTNRKNQVSDNIQLVFAYDYLVLDETHLKLYLDGDTDNPLTGYTVTGIGNNLGGTAIFTVAPAAGTLSLVREVPLKQTFDYITGGKFPADTHERLADLLVMMVQELDDRMNRSLQLPVSSSVGDLTLPEPIADYLLQWNATSDGLNNVHLSTLGDLVVTTAFTESLLNDPDADTFWATINASLTNLAMTKTIAQKKGADIASANDCILLQDGNYNNITGVTDINGFTDGLVNEIRHFRASSIFTLKHNVAPSAGFSKLFIVQGATDITTVVDDEFSAIFDGAIWRIFNYNKSSITPSFRGALVYNSSSESLISGTPKLLSFDSEDYDTSDIHDIVVNNTRLTVPSGVTKIKVSAQVYISDADITKLNSGSIALYKNGSNVFAGNARATVFKPESTDGYFAVTSPILIVDADDYFEFRCSVSTSDFTALTAESGSHRTWFSMEIIE